MSIRIVAAVACLVASAGAFGADYYIRSLPYQAVRVPVVKQSTWGLASQGPCGCKTALLCTGPRGGRYCITDKGDKRYK